MTIKSPCVWLFRQYLRKAVVCVWSQKATYMAVKSMTVLKIRLRCFYRVKLLRIYMRTRQRCVRLSRVKHLSTMDGFCIAPCQITANTSVSAWKLIILMPTWAKQSIILIPQFLLEAEISKIISCRTCLQRWILRRLQLPVKSSWKRVILRLPELGDKQE